MPPRHTMAHTRSILAFFLLALVAAPAFSAPAADLAERDQVTLLRSRGAAAASSSSSATPPRKPTTRASTSTSTSYSTKWTTTSVTRTVATRTTTKNIAVTSNRKTTTTTTTTKTTKPTSTTTKKTSTSSKPSSTTKASSTTKSSASSTPTHSSKIQNTVYYPDWTASQIPPENVDYSLFDIFYYSFAIPAADFSLYWTQWNSADILKRLIKNAHANGSKVCITIGGWTGSQYFSDAVKNSQNRETFANNIVAMVNEYGADGVDIDWEYPGQSGASGNIISPNDSANLLTFLALLRGKMGSGAHISLATPDNVWYGSSGSPMTDVSQYAKYIDHVLLMNYDVWGASANPGPNAPYGTCSGSWQPGANAIAAVAAWKQAGMPASKIMLGLPAYGYVSDSTATTLIHKRSQQMEALHARQVAVEARSAMREGNQRPQHMLSERRDLETRAAGDISSFKGGPIQWNQLISNKVLSLSTTGVWYGKNGFTRKWDDCSSTPYAYNQASSTVVTYDDPTSLKIKAQFAREQGLAGVGTWDISGDTSDWVLMKAINSGLGR